MGELLPFQLRARNLYLFHPNLHHHHAGAVCKNARQLKRQRRRVFHPSQCKTGTRRMHTIVMKDFCVQEFVV